MPQLESEWGSWIEIILYRSETATNPEIIISSLLSKGQETYINMLYFPVCLSHPQYPDFKISQSGFNVRATTSLTLPELTCGREPIAACMDHDLGSSLACPIHPGAQAQAGAHKKTRLQQCCCLGTTRTAHHVPKPLPKALQEGFRRGDLCLGLM